MLLLVLLKSGLFIALLCLYLSFKLAYRFWQKLASKSSYRDCAYTLVERHPKFNERLLPLAWEHASQKNSIAKSKDEVSFLGAPCSEARGGPREAEIGQRRGAATERSHISLVDQYKKQKLEAHC